tara:strand:- start:196 stop:513 length:318 start_codon:yes stop_codon:yes gene_type:complete
MKVSVYKLINTEGEVVYIGESKRPKRRLKEHIQYCRESVWYGHDLNMEIVQEFDNKQDAYALQCELQESYGMVTDREKARINAIKGGAAIMANGNHNWLAKNRYA